MDAHTTESLHPALEGLSPRNLWTQFDGLRKQPRPSTKEHQAVRWVCDWAQTNGFEVTKDEIGNICVKVPASDGATSIQTVCLQGHIDMVCAKDPNSTHNFETDPIELKRDGNLLKANRTTLGADNGIGIAAMMAAATDPSVEHPAMELLLTRDEEDGFSGVDNLDPKALDMKSTRVLNLDTEEIGQVVVKSAGFHGVEGTLPVEREADMPPGEFIALNISGFKGGHSGLDIEKGRGNPILSMKDLIRNVLPKGAALVSFNVEGGKDNAIPTSARAIVHLPRGIAIPSRAIMDVINKFTDGASLDISTTDVSEAEKGVSAMTMSTNVRILSALDAMPNGVLEMHDQLDDVVGVSSNIGIVSTTDDEFKVGLSARAFSDAKLSDAVNNAKDVFAGHGFTPVSKTVIGGWDGNPDSPLTKAALEAYREATDGKEAKVTGANCGLEVADVVRKLRGHLDLAEDVSLDGVSFGPTLHSVHSPDENVEIHTVDVFYEQLVALLGKLARAEA